DRARSCSPGRRVGRARVAGAGSAAEEADLVGVLIDARKGFEESRQILQRLGDVKAPKLLVLNKIDLVAKGVLLAVANEANNAAKFEATFMGSALTGDGVGELKAWLAERRPPGPGLWPPRPAWSAP